MTSDRSSDCAGDLTDKTMKIKIIFCDVEFEADDRVGVGVYVGTSNHDGGDNILTCLPMS